MRAPIENFNEEIVDDNIDVYCCSNRSCESHIVRGINIEKIFEESIIINAKASNCINIYVKSKRLIEIPTCYIATAIEIPKTGTIVYCRNCDNALGYCSGNGSDEIAFDWHKLNELWICNDDECIKEFSISDGK